MVGGANGFLDLFEDRIDLRGRDVAEEGVAKHFYPVFDAVCSILQFGWPVEMGGEADAEGFFLQQAGIFAYRGEVPELCCGILIVTMTGEHFTGGQKDLFDVSFAAHFKNEAAAGLQMSHPSP